MKKKGIVVFILTLFVLLLSITAFASTTTSIFVEDTVVAENEEIVVPIKINDNVGICGATLSISYDSALNLKSISVGDALRSLTMTKPGNMDLNPFNLVFDGIEEDATDGVIAYLYFESMSKSGIYDISVTYEAGDIVNGKLEALEVKTENGKVTIGTTDDTDSNEDVETHDEPIISFGKTIATAGDSVDVPVYIKNNTGICGAKLEISYDKSLTLTNITKGTALPNLIMTKPGDMTVNPFNLVFDGIEEDTGNGLFFTLTFTAPLNDGVYDITATYEEGDVVNGNLSPTNPLIKKGNVTVGAEGISVTVGGEKVTLPPTAETDGAVYIAFYTESGHMLTSVKSFDLSNKVITVDADSNADYAKVFCWNNELMPLSETKKITLK